MTEPVEPPPFDLDVRVGRAGDAHVVALSGELDVDSAPPVHAAVDDALRAGPPLLVLDLSEVVFFGSPGLSLLLGAHERALGAGGAVAVVADRRPVLRPLEVTGVTAVLDIYASRAEALDALGSVVQRTGSPATGDATTADPATGGPTADPTPTTDPGA
ncbi:STAS domain-containing protein [Saccharothrix lopnurensis]|uniref:Anti-sigma factor antagonist n=1 Tax=Saccharothrix lopnurensis TaxID=1670621 RepID=A0ABW1NWN7_9PSEU